MEKLNARVLVTSDLHLGKSVGDYSLIEDQKYALDQVLDLAKKHQVEAVIIAGDIYDRGVPPEWAVPLFNAFITQLYRAGIKVVAVTGNHDSEGRMEYGSEIFADQGVHIVSTYCDARVKPVVLGREQNIYLYPVPCVRPGQVDFVINGERPEGEEDAKRISNFPDAMTGLIKGLELDPEKINVMVTHQLIIEDGSEAFYDLTKSGNLSPIPVSVFEPLDLVLTGHIHRRKNVGKGKAHYPGSLLKYKPTDEGKRCVSLVSFGAKGEIEVEALEIKVLHDVRVEAGTYAELKEQAYTEDYVELHLLDEAYINDIADKLRKNFPNQLSIRFVNVKGGDGNEGVEPDLDLTEKSTLDVVKDFFANVGGGRELSPQELEYLEKYIGEIEQEYEGKAD